MSQPMTNQVVFTHVQADDADLKNEPAELVGSAAHCYLCRPCGINHHLVELCRPTMRT